MTPGEAAASAAIDAAYSEEVIYTGGGLPGPTPLMVIWSDTAGEPFQGAGNTTRVVSVEIHQSDLPARPAKADRIRRGSTVWHPNDVTPRDDIGKWAIVLARVA